MEEEVSRNLIIPNETIRKLDSLDQKYDSQLFIHTLNAIFIDAGLHPDIPIGMHPGQFKTPGGIWIPGVRYTQYHDWPDYIEEMYTVQEGSCDDIINNLIVYQN